MVPDLIQSAIMLITVHCLLFVIKADLKWEELLHCGATHSKDEYILLHRKCFLLPAQCIEVCSPYSFHYHDICIGALEHISVFF